MKQNPEKQESKTQELGKKEHFIGHHNDAPSYMKVNLHIIKGYRIGFDSPSKILRSLFMIHNESVNIWTHFLPAILIFCLIFYLLVFVGPTNIMHDFEIARNKLSEGISDYSDALNNLTFVVKMKEIKSETNREVEEITRSIAENYASFEQGLHDWKTHAQAKISSLQHEVKSSFASHLSELEVLKQDFEKVFVPYVLNGIKDKIDPAHLETLTQRLEKLKEKIDSESFNYLEINSRSGPQLHQVSRWPLFVLLASAVVCLSCSTLYHLFYPMSRKAHKIFSRFDYAGINVLMVGSTFPGTYYGMYCNMHVAVFYLSIISTIGITLFVLSLFEFLNRHQNARIKSMCYGGFGICLGVPMAHLAINSLFFNSSGDPFTNSQSAKYYLLCGFFYLSGLYIYTLKCPQRNRPQQFSVCGNSHQIWHIFVLFGIIATYFGALEDFQMRKNCICPAT